MVVKKSKPVGTLESEGYEEPQVEEVGSNTVDQCITHPAYGLIGASRVSGNTALFGSDFMHQHYVTIQISRADLHRSLSRDWPAGRGEIIEVALSEAQWATFVSSMNVGQGIQCTIQHQNHQRTPQIPRPPERHQQFAREASERLAKFDQEMAELERMVGKVNMGSKAKEELLFKMQIMRTNLPANIKFVGDQFVEHMEDVTEAAKVEVNAYLTSAIHQTGIKALQEGAPIALPKSKEVKK
jgi:hypothetical protein